MKYTLILEGKKEFYPNLNNKIYKILLVDTPDKIIFMSNFFKNFIEQQNKNLEKKFYLGMDFEYNRVRKTQRDIALFQINLENDIDNEGYIFVFYPPELNKSDCQILIDLICHPKMIKIIHGGESLDIPYLFDQLIKDEKNIYNFCKNLYDTKYLCEYYHLDVNSENKKCSIYYLLEEQKIITSKQFNDLESIEEKTGPIYLIDIKIHNINFDVFRYSLYDVLFLADLIKKFLGKSKIYTELIPEISQIVFQYKRNIKSVNLNFNELKENINKFNIRYVEENNTKYQLNNFYEYYYLTLYDKSGLWDKIKKITYFKDFFETILKYVIYESISNRQTIYINKSQISEKIRKYDFSYYKNLNELINILKEQVMKY